MPFNVQSFRSSMTGDGARPNLFEVMMPFPTELARATGVPTSGGSNPASAQAKLTFTCRSAQLPGATIGAVPVNYFGREIKLPGNRVYDEWNITIFNDEDFVVRNTFEKWMAMINSHQGNLRSPAFLNQGRNTTPGGGGGYTCNPTVRQYGKTGDLLKEYTFVGMFPTNLSQIDVDWGSNDMIEEFSVSLAFQWYETDNTIL